ncbi:hypothetical protein [Cupriavidus numazuensis]|uniref:Uncharacterized protein n=1 Tax=Cupriavidus numazuensis TaxID=221992 RepID=A0ABN7QEZ1_9BURK|nr:hypothetical protein [Cupriavidus numazuensis]CAG2159974.1 hypothetical protein LMG26411_07126 [Cupriavidus numazuensis]
MDAITDPLQLSAPQLLDWVCQPRRNGDTFNLAPDPSRLSARGFTTSSQHPLPGSLGEVQIVSAIRRHYRIERFEQPLADCFILIPMRTTLDAHANTVLGLQGSLNAGVRQTIVDTFLAYSPTHHGAALTYLAARLSEFNHDHPPGLNGAEFGLFLDATFTWRGVQKKFDEVEWLHAVFEGNAHPRVPELCPERDRNLGHDGYRFVYIGEEYIQAIPPLRESKNVVTLQQGEPEGLAVIKRSQELARVKNRDCEFLEPHKIRITSINLIDETKLVHELVYIRHQSCGYHILMPALRTRSVQNVLYATVTWSNRYDVKKTVFTKSAHEAAILAAPVALINFEEGLAIFKAEFWRLIKERALQNFGCLIPELILIKQAGGWWPAGWPEPKESDEVESH